MTKEEVDIQATQAASIRVLIDAGFTKEKVVAAVTKDDLTLLVDTAS
jgi:hypothetical protein